MCPRPVAIRFVLPALLLLVPLLVQARSPAAATGPRHAQPTVTRFHGPPPPRLDVARSRPVAATGIDRWHEAGLLQTENQAAFYDAANDRLISLGGDRNGVWELPLHGTIAWRVLLGNQNQPWPVGWWASEYDAAGGDMYFQAVGPGNTVVICRMDPTTGVFQPIPADHPPVYPYIPYMTMAFDAANRRFFLFGGQNDDFTLPDDVWVLDLLPTPAWSKWSPAGPSPQGRIGAALVMDPARHRLLMLGGLANVSPGVWALSLDAAPTWTQLSTEALPGDANFNGMVFDPAGDRVLALHSSGDVWSFSLPTHTWSVLAPSGPHPPGRLLVPLVMDTVHRRLLVAGGLSADESDHLNDAWALSLDDTPRWTPLVANRTRPPRRAAAGYGTDPARDRLVVFGGANHEGALRNDTWTLDFGTLHWSELATQGTPPPGRYWAASAFDPVRDQLVLFGGYGGSGSPNFEFADLWTLSFADGTPTWTAHDPPGEKPSGRYLATMVYDPGRDRFIVLYGSNGQIVFDELWELRFQPEATWRRMSPIGFPTPRWGALAVCDVNDNRLILFGGGTPTQLLNDTWVLDLARDAWYPLTPTQRPTRRSMGLFEFDPNADRALLFGGENDATFFPYPLNDAWVLSLNGVPDWGPLDLAGAPPARSRLVGGFDAARSRLVVSSGGFDNLLNDTWALESSDPVAPVELALTTMDATPYRVRLGWDSEPGLFGARLERRLGSAAWQVRADLEADPGGHFDFVDSHVAPGDPLEYRLAVNRDGEEFLLGLASIEVPQPTPVPPPAPPALELRVSTPAPGVAFRLELPSAEPATLSVYDVTGRRVWGREVGSLGPGGHDLDANDMAWRAGIYFARLVQGTETRRARFAVVQ
jgi:hypothetical protein